MHDLGQIGGFHRGTEADPAAVGGLFGEQAAQKRCFTRAVVAQDGNALSSFDVQLHPVKEGAAIVGFGQILHRKDHVAKELLFSEAGLHSFFGLGPFGLADPLHAVLHSHGPAVEHPVVDAPALHPLDGIAQLLDLGLLLLVLLELQIEAGLLFLQIEGIVAVVMLGLAIGDLDDPVNHAVEEIAVMRDGQRGALELPDIALKPLDAAKIQVVGGLVEQQNIRLFQKEPCQVHAGFFSAGKGGKQLLALSGGNAKAVADLVYGGVHFIAAADLIGCAQAVILRKQGPLGTVLHLALKALHLRFHGKQIPIRRAQDVLYGVGLRIDGDLRDQTDPPVRGKDNGALVRLNFAGEHPKKRGLAAAVAAHDAHAFAGMDLKGKSVQELLAHFKGLFQVLYG